MARFTSDHNSSLTPHHPFVFILLLLYYYHLICFLLVHIYRTKVTCLTLPARPDTFPDLLLLALCSPPISLLFKQVSEKNLIIQKYFFWLQNFVLPGSTFQKLSITHTFFFKACRYLSLVTAFWKRSEANKSVSLWIFSIFLSFLFLWFLVVYCHTNCYQAVELTVSRRGVHSGWLTFSFLFLPSWYTASVFVWLWMCVHAYGCVCKCLCLLHRCDLTVACF